MPKKPPIYQFTSTPLVTVLCCGLPPSTVPSVLNFYAHMNDEKKDFLKAKDHVVKIRSSFEVCLLNEVQIRPSLLIPKKLNMSIVCDELKIKQDGIKGGLFLLNIPLHLSHKHL